MTDRPRVDNAPGLIFRRRKGGWIAYWQCRSDLARRGFRPQSRQLWQGNEPREIDRIYISEQCNALQSEMLVWGRGGIPTLDHDGTIAGLVDAYQLDPDSPYRKLRFRTRANYTTFLRRLAQDHGSTELAEIKARTLLAWHQEWSAAGHVAMAHRLVGTLRTIINFGATFLEDADCERLAAALHRMRFKMARPRQERLTAAQADVVRAKAHETGWHSIAIAQAFQFDCMLRQKDVIGEWEPIAEPGASEVTAGGQKWLRGLRWSEIDGNLILRHTTSKRQKDIEVDLKLCPMVLEEFKRLKELPETGPMIVSEYNGLPFTAHEFRRRWRIIATAAGIPAHVYNMDSRAGAISEATDAGAELEHVRHAATHSDIGMTQRYSRGGVEKTANVMRLRVAYRNKSGTE